MNEQQFLKEIRKKKNENGRFTYAIVGRLLKENKSLAILSKSNIFARIFQRSKDRKSAQQIILDHLEEILNRTNDEDLCILISDIFHLEMSPSTRVKNFSFILTRLSYANNSLMVQKAKKLLFMKTRQLEGGPELLLERVDQIIENGIELEESLVLKGLSQETDEKLNANLEQNKQQVIEEILEQGLKKTKLDDHKKDAILDDYATTVRIMIEELLASEKIRWLDIKPLGEGGYSSSYQIGSKVLKFGDKRETYQIPNHERILQPLVRTNFLEGEDENKVLACVEIQDKVQKVDSSQISEEELYQVYKELREDGIIWTDASYSNVGRLIKPNTPSLNGEEMYVAPQAVGMDREIKEKRLKPGDLVIIDTDYIYRENDTFIKWPKRKLSFSFEKI